MEGRLLLKNCSVFRPDGRIRNGLAVLVEGGRVSRIAPDDELPVLPGDWEIACRGRLVSPGLVDCHTHLVSAQLLPLSGELLLLPSRKRAEQRRALEERLTASDVEVLTRHALARAARAGVTLSVEHLHAPRDVVGSLEAQARVASQLGVRLVSSHATQSLQMEHGVPVQAQVEANVAFVQAHRSHPLVRGALGFYSSATSDDALLRLVGRLREELGVGAHFHLAENEDDLLDTFQATGKRVVPRLEAFGLLGPGVVASYAHAVDRSEAERLAKTRTLIALSPRVMQLLDSGQGGWESLAATQNLLALGTAGHGTLWEELSSALASTARTARLGRLIDPDGMMSQLLVGAAAELCSMLYGAPSGTVEEGSLADLVVHDFVPAGVGLEGRVAHVLYALSRAPVAWTIVDGRVVVREGKLLVADEVELAAAAASRLDAIWAASA